MSVVPYFTYQCAINFHIPNASITVPTPLPYRYISRPSLSFKFISEFYLNLVLTYTITQGCGAETICFRSGSDFQKVSAPAPAPEPAPT